MGIRVRRCLDGYFLRLVKRIMHMPFGNHLSYVEAEELLDVYRPLPLPLLHLQYSR